MIALWMVYTVVVTATLTAGAALLDRATLATVRQRRWIWVFALGLSAGIPTWTAVAPRVGLAPGPRIEDRRPLREPNTIPLAGTISASAIADLVARADSTSLGMVSSTLGVVWSASVLIAVATYAGAMASLARRRRRWRSAEIDGQPVLLAPGTGPAVVGALRPHIVIPEWSLTLPAEQRDLMLEHERQHVVARDPLLLQGAAAIALMMPWNLAAWWLVRRLRLAVELDCDARVLASGRNSRTYGNLLLDVCARRLRPGVMLAPALFERSSSLTRRILAMHASRPRFAGARAALGLAAALMITAFACDMPSPEVVAPDGTNQATKRLYGAQATITVGAQDVRATDDRAMVARYFPEIAQGVGGSRILFVVRSSTGAVVLTESQTANEPIRTKIEAEKREGAVAENVVREGPQEGARLEEPKRTALAAEMRMAETKRGVMVAKVRARPGFSLPAGVGALEGNDIATIDVSKHAPGTVSPNAISLITITLKPGARVPTPATR
jgi:hypothetical protein